MAGTVTNKYVIDVCALIAYLRSEDGGDKLREFLKQPTVLFFMHAVSLGEVCYDSLRYIGLSKAKELLDEVVQLPITVVWELDRAFLEGVGRYKTSCRVSYADCFVLALAEQEKATVISTGHHEFDVLSKANVLLFYWLR